MPRCGNCRDFVGNAYQIIEHQRQGCSIDPKWSKVVSLHGEGQHDKAAHLAKRILGVKKKGKSAPMTAETKEYLRRLKAERKAAGVVTLHKRQRMM